MVKPQMDRTEMASVGGLILLGAVLGTSNICWNFSRRAIASCGLRPSTTGPLASQSCLWAKLEPCTCGVRVGPVLLEPLCQCGCS